jgi:hypothetical protein
MLCRLSLLVLPFLAMGCLPSPSDHYDIYINSGFSDTERSETIAMLRVWEKATPVTFDIHLVDTEHQCGDHCYNVEPTTSASLWSRNPGRIGETYTNTGCDCGTILLDTQISNPMERQTMIAHEIGHALDLVHVGPGQLMYPNYGPGQPSKITCGDQEQYASLRGRSVKCVGDVSLTLVEE